MQCIALYREGNWAKLAVEDLSRADENGNNILHIICSRGDLEALRNLASRAEDKVRTAIQKANKQGETPLAALSQLNVAKREKIVEYLKSLGIDVDQPQSSFDALVGNLIEAVQREAPKIPREDDDLVRKLVASIRSFEGGRASKENEFDDYENPLLANSEKSSGKSSKGKSSRGGRADTDAESDWSGMFETDTQRGAGCSAQYELTDGTRQRARRDIARDVASLCGGYTWDQVVDGGAAKKKDRDEDPEEVEVDVLSPSNRDEDDEDDEDDDDMYGGLSSERSAGSREREYAALVRTLESSEFERLTRVPSDIQPMRPRNPEIDETYRSFVKKLMDALDIDEETAKLYRSAIKIHLGETKPELKKHINDELKVKEMEKIISNVRTLKATMKKINLEEIKAYMNSMREASDKRRGEKKTDVKKTREKRLPKKETQPSRTRFGFVLSESPDSDSDSD